MKQVIIVSLAIIMSLLGGGMNLEWSSQADNGVLHLSMALPHALAQDGGGDSGESDDDTCTSDFKSDGEESEDGLLTQIIDYIKDIIDDTSMALYSGVIEHTAFKDAVSGAFTLFIALFGAAFMFGIVPLTFGQALTRALKMAVILALISDTGWEFFNDYAVEFFNKGTDELIDAVIGIATGDGSAAETDEEGDIKPFKKLEDVVGDALSPEMMVAALTSFTTGPMGPAMGAMLGISIVAFIQMLIKALRVYCISLIAKALLFGLAPIFISFILFERTKHIFTGWVNQLVNYSLQPLLLFAFLSFFVVLIDSAVENILERDICWSTVEHFAGATTESMYWRFADEEGNPTSSDFSWSGLVSCIQAGGECEDFPISILDILTFFILAHLAYRFSDVVVNIATEIASSTLFLDKLRSGLGEFMQQQGSVGSSNKPPGR